MEKILFIVPDLNPGGAQKVMSFLAKEINRDLFNVKMIVLGNKTETSFDLTNTTVKYLNKSRLLSAVKELFFLIKKEKPSVVFSSIWHINIVLGFFSFFFKNVNFVAREASVISNITQFSKLHSFLFNSFVGKIYLRFNKIVCQSGDMEKDFIENFKIKPHKLVTINNPITQNIKVKDKREFKDILNFVTVGRLSEEKGHLRILKILSKITQYDYDYTIIGSGGFKQEIEEQIKLLNLENKVNFIGYSSTILQDLKEYDFFLQGSYVEGFPNALLESSTVGTPVIAFNAPGGTKEIVKTNVNGFLVETEEEFVSVLNDYDSLKKINNPEKIRKAVVEKFEASIILNQYEKMFLSLKN